MTAHFIDPHPDYAASYVEAIEDGLDLHPMSVEEIRLIKNNFHQWLHDIHDLSRPVILPNGEQVMRVSETLRWLVDGDNYFIGRVGIRHHLNHKLRQLGGHIGYSVRPSERRKGYGRILLREGMRVLSSLDVSQVLLTCNDDNTGSIKIIEGAGGILEKKARIAGNEKVTRYYWIDL